MLLLTVCLLTLLPTQAFVSCPMGIGRRPRNAPTLHQKSGDPNDSESPQDQEARMALVRQIQANFYASNDTTTTQQKWLQTDPLDPTLLYNVPLWRVQWTELPGFQNVLNVHVPHYTHMFRQLLYQHAPPWYFGHLYLPGGSENLGQPAFNLPEKEETVEDTLPTLQELKQQVKVTTIGTLMQVTDYIEQDDGRLTLIVQAIDRIQILTAAQQVPYSLAAKVRIIPDTESWLDIQVKPNVGKQVLEFTLQESLHQAMQAVAERQGRWLRPLEYHATTLQHIRDNNNNDINNSPLEISPLSNVNASAQVDFEAMQVEMQKVYLERMATKAQEYGSDEIMIAAATMSVQNTSHVMPESIATLEVDLWIGLDRLLALLEKVNPAVRIPVPSQLLGLLPTNVTWPKGFRLEKYAQTLQDHQVQVGTFSQTPFCRLSQQYPLYPPLRRASRLSYTVWVLLQGIGVGRQGLTKQIILQMASIQKRLQAALKHIEAINAAIEQMLE